MIRQRIAKMDDVKQHQKDNKKDNYHYSDKYRRLQLKAPSDLLTLSPQYKQYRRYYQKDNTTPSVYINASRRFFLLL